MADLSAADLDRLKRWAERHDAHVLMRTDDVLALLAEVERLREGIRAHRDRTLRHGLDCDGSTDEPLWALLDEREETT